MRCRRESKECYFSATRRKRKTEDGREGSLDGLDYNEDYVVRNGRKMVHGSPGGDVRQDSMGAPPSVRSTGQYVDNAPIIPPLTPGGSIGRTQPLRRPQQDDQYRQVDESSMQLENPEANLVMRKEVYGYVLSFHAGFARCLAANCRIGDKVSWIQLIIIAPMMH